MVYCYELCLLPSSAITGQHILFQSQYSWANYSGQGITNVADKNALQRVPD